MSETASAFETPADAGQGEAGEVRLWLDAIATARKAEEHWRKKATAAVERYRDEKDRDGRRFNILFANTQTVLPAVYNSTPVPDVRRRFGDADPVGKIISQVLERASSYMMDEYDFDAAMRCGCWDMEVTGRGVVRVRYEPTLQDEQVVDEAVTCEYVDWRDFIVGPGRRWSEVPWVAFEHRLTREELTQKFGPIGETMPLDFIQEGFDKQDARDVPEVFKRGLVYEVWNKQAREVLFLARSVPQKPLLREPDPLGLKGFWPLPRPLYSIVETGSLVPLVPYELYRDQAEELDRVTARITALVNMVKWRGARAEELSALNDIADARDGDFVPVKDWQQFASSTGGKGLEAALWMVPIAELVATIRELVIHRDEIKRVIYEITGLSDILRGATDPKETYGAQKIKSQWGSLRIEDRQAEVARFARDLLRIKCEIIAEKFQPQTLAAMTGTNLPTPEQKMQASMGHNGGPPMEPDPAMQEMLQTPTWDELIKVMRSDALRSYRVDIETDSTVQADVARNQENAGRFVDGLGSFIQAIGPAVASGQFPREVAADLMGAFARNFKLGRQAEDAMEKLKNAPPPPEPPGAEAEQAKSQAEMQKAQAEIQKVGVAAQAEQTKAQLAMQQAQQAAQADAARLQQEAEAGAMDMEFKREQHTMRMVEMREKHAITMAELQAKAAMPKPEPKAPAK